MPQTYEELLENAGWVRNLCRNLVRDPHQAEDAVQDTWVRALQHSPDEPRALKKWLKTVATNAVFQRSRRETARRSREERAPERTNQLPTPAEALEKASMRREVVDAVLSLEEPYRTTIVLRYFEELPTREVARVQGITTSTVRSQTQRALEKLRLKLESEYDAEEHGGRSLDGMLLWLATAPPVAAGFDGSASESGSAAKLLKTLAVPSVAVWAVLATVFTTAGVGWWAYETKVAQAGSNDDARDERGTSTLPGGRRVDSVESNASQRKGTEVATAEVRVLEATTGQPILGVRVQASYARADAGGALMTQAVDLGETDDNGALGLALPADAADVERARTRLLFEHDEYLDWQLTSREVAAQLDGDPIEVRLFPLGTLEVEVVDPDGVPLSGLAVRAKPQVERGRTEDGSLLRRGRSGPAGTSELLRLPCGVPIHVELSADRGRDEFTFLTSEVVIEPPSRHARVVLKAPETAALTGVVLDADGQSQVLAVHWYGPVAVGASRSVPRFVQTDEQGRFQLDYLRPGQGSLWVGESREPIALELVAGELRDLGTLSLEPDVVLAGRLQREGDASLAGLWVHVFRNGRFQQETWTSTDGGFRFRTQPGEVELVVSEDSWSDGAREQRILTTSRIVAPLETVVLVLEGAPQEDPDASALGAPANVAVRVLGPDGQPAPGALLTVRTADGTLESYLADDDGRVLLERLTAGLTELTASLGGVGISAITELTLQAGETEEAEIALERFATLRLRTEDADAHPLAFEGALLREHTRETWHWTSESDGRRAYEELTPGDYQLWWNGTYRPLSLDPGEELELVLAEPPASVELELLRGDQPATDLEGGLLLPIDPVRSSFGVARRTTVVAPGVVRVDNPGGRSLLAVRRIGPNAGRWIVTAVQDLQKEREQVQLGDAQLEVARTGAGPALRTFLIAVGGTELPERLELDFVWSPEGRQVFPHVPAGATLWIEGLDGVVWRGKEVAFPASGSTTVTWP